MKSKLKNPDVAKKQGPAYVKKLLKKRLLEDIVEPTKFFYHSEFDYQEEEEPCAVMFIGEIPSLWKKWIKTVKTSKAFVAGRCLFDRNTKELKLEVSMGKGGKAMVLKGIQKQLLKPFAVASFVESLDVGVSLEEVEEKEVDNEETTKEEPSDVYNISDYIKEVQSFFKEGSEVKNNISTLVNGLGSKLKNLSQIIVTDELIVEAKKGTESLKNLNIPDFLKEKNVWMNDIPDDILNNDDFVGEIKKLEDLEKELIPLSSESDELVKNCGLLKKVENPEDSDVPPISNEPIVNFGMAIKKHLGFFN